MRLTSVLYCISVDLGWRTHSLNEEKSEIPICSIKSPPGERHQPQVTWNLGTHLIDVKSDFVSAGMSKSPRSEVCSGPAW